jgi:hypothetical protein
MSPVGNKTMVALLAAAALSGCAGNGSGLDANGDPITPGGGATEPLTADFQSIQDNVFTPICTKCHIGAGAPEGLQLDEAHSYALLVGVASTEQPSVLRVSAGDPDSSYIVRKLQDTGGISGGQMPLGGPYLPQSTIDVIRQWITAGAAKSATTAAVTAAAKSSEPSGTAGRLLPAERLNVEMTSPDNDSVVSTVLPRIVVAFSSDVDPALVNYTTVTLQKIAVVEPPDAQATASPESTIRAATTIPAGNNAAIVITPRTPLASGTYRVTLHGTLADMSARALGSDYSFTFTVDATQ